MKAIRASLLLAALPVVGLTETVSYVDPFGTAATSCPASECDVIGDPTWFDLDRFSMTLDVAAMTANITVSLNFGPYATLTPFYDFGIRLDAADVLFSVGGVVRYGIPLTPHGGSLQAGHLYLVNPGGVLSAFDVLQLGAGYVYRPEFPVWLRDDGAGSVVEAAAGTLTAARTGDGVNSGAMSVSITFVPTAAFIAELNSGLFTAQFASATCGNDVMVAPIRLPGPEGTPEPGTLTLLLLGGAILAWRQLKAARPRPSIAHGDRAGGGPGNPPRPPVLHE
jgi:hypothetical protein